MKIKVFSLVLVILWMTFIFYQSHKPAIESNELSTEIAEKIVETVEKVVPNTDIDVRDLNHILRKNAHFFTYLLLGFLVANCLEKNGISTVFTSALFICILYAISDEVHQLYVHNRGGQIKDVIIDSAGALVGIWGFYINKRLRGVI